MTFEQELRNARAAQGFIDPLNPRIGEVVALGGGLAPKRLLTAYANGIFPWPGGESEPIYWHCPEVRPVFRPGETHIGRSDRRALRRRRFQFSFDLAFHRVIRACAAMPRADQGGTWITEEMIAAYDRLHRLGFVHSAEAWLGDALVGGVYGVALGGAFFGESMFRLEPDASKLALVALLRRLRDWDYRFMDCQMTSSISERLGAVEWDRETFQRELTEALKTPSRRGRWESERAELAL